MIRFLSPYLHTLKLTKPNGRERASDKGGEGSEATFLIIGLRSVKKYIHLEDIKFSTTREMIFVLYNLRIL